jgi:arylsulfatase A-like enzyme
MQLESLQAVDEAVAGIIQALQDIGQDQTTMIIYASDNGYSWGSRALIDQHQAWDDRARREQGARRHDGVRADARAITDERSEGRDAGLDDVGGGRSPRLRLPEGGGGSHP